MVRFERRDLLSDPPPPGQHDLIACRNVLIYFDRDTQSRLFEAFFDALAPGGYLVLGKVETLLGPARSRFAGVDPRERIFRRPA
jgi:chemotaxis methyl-accepting protein methylase